MSEWTPGPQIQKYQARLAAGGSAGGRRPSVIELVDGQLIADRLRNLSKAVAGKVVRGILTDGIGPMVPAMRARIHRVSGLLQSGLKLKMGKGDKNGKYSVYVDSVVTARRFAEKKKSYHVAPGRAGRKYRVYYAGMVEFGHRIAGSSESVPEHSFLRSVFNEQSGEATETIETGFAEAVEETF